MSINKHRIYLLCVVVLQCFFGQTQNSKPSDEAKTLFDAHKFEKTITFAGEQIDILLKSKQPDSLEIAKLYEHLVASHCNLRNNQIGLDKANIALQYCPNTEAGQQIKAQILYWRSFPEYFLNQPYQSLDSKKEAVRILKSLINPDLNFLSRLYAELSIDMAFMGYLDKASNYLDNAIQTNTIKNNNDKKQNTYSIENDLHLWLKFRLAQVLGKKIDAAYELDDQQKIKSIINAFLDFKKQNPTYWDQTNKRRLGIIYSYYGNSFIAELNPNKNPDSALFYNTKAAKIIKKEEDKDQYNIIQYNIANAYNGKEDYKKALEIINQQIAEKDNPNISSYNKMRALLLYKLKEYEQWETIVFETISKIHSGSAPLKSDFSNFEPSTSITQTGDIIALAKMIASDPQEHQIFQETKCTLYNLAIQQFKQSYRFTTFNSRLSDYYKSIFKGLLTCNDNSEDITTLKQILNNSENIENRLAWQQFTKNRRLVSLPLIDSLEQAEYKLRGLLVQAKQQNQKRKVDSILEKLEQHNSHLDANYKKLSSFTQNDFDVNQFQQHIPNDEVVLKYMFFEKQLMVFEITNTSLQFYISAWQDKERALLEEKISAIKNKDTQDFIDDQDLLTQILVPKTALNYNSLVVVADGPLYQLPFEVLSYKNNYLVEQKRIRYSSHLRFIYREDTENDEINTDPLVGIFAPNYPEGDIQLTTRSAPYHLEGAQKEAKTIGRIFNTNTYLGSEATKSQFIKHKADGSILHLAMHATMDDLNPEYSHFNFPNEEKLYLEELYALKMPLDLAVLGACNTAVGSEDKGLNVKSLHRAFNFAGTEATIASLWEVPDASTSEIMIAFYDYLKQGESKSKALQLAKLDYLKNTEIPKLRHPYYWAGFVLYGHDYPVTSSHNSWIWLGLLLVLAVLFSFFWIRKRNNVKQ